MSEKKGLPRIKFYFLQDTSIILSNFEQFLSNVLNPRVDKNFVLGNDNYIRDLAGLRGTYKLIDKTELALDYLYKFLQEKILSKLIFILIHQYQTLEDLK